MKDKNLKKLFIFSLITTISIVIIFIIFFCINNKMIVIAKENIGSIIENISFSENTKTYIQGIQMNKYLSSNAYTTEDGNYTQEEIEIGDVDFISPDFTYKYSESSIDHGTKMVQLIFDVTDKFYDANQEEIKLNDLEILIKVDDNRIDNLSNIDCVGKYLTSQEIFDTINGVESTVIGRRYTLTITNLEQLESDVLDREYTTIDYSGILTIAIKGGIVKDIYGNQNMATTITVGVDIPGGTGTGEIVDVVAPIFEKVENGISNFNDQIVSMKIKVTDTYYDIDSLLTEDEIVVYLNGTISTNCTVEVIKQQTLTEQRIINGIASTESYGQEYTIQIGGLILSQINQVKIKILANAIEDKYGNNNVETQFIIFNCLKSTNTETQNMSEFLGNTELQRQNIENIEFFNNTLGKNETVWDVSAIGDNSILAWYEDSDNNGLYEVYIGSSETINANTDASYLFSYIGYNLGTTKTETIKNINILNTNNVTNMNSMFQYCGYTAMIELDLGNNFFTTQVETMKDMFQSCGYTAMTTLNLQNNFDTSNVINMESMFENCGYTALTKLNLPNKFYTNNVTNMKSMFSGLGYTSMNILNLGSNFNTENVVNMELMFKNCGYKLLSEFSLGTNFNTSKVENMESMFQNFGHETLVQLNLENKFDTSSVKNMKAMFNECGYVSMYVLTLGDKFNTANVINMESMFKNCGYESLRTLELGKSFYTVKVTNMGSMFEGCGHVSLSVLDLGPAFTYIAETNSGFVTNCGNNQTIIYCGESIYSTMYKFKLNTNSETTISYLMGKINPKYTPYWEKMNNTINENTVVVTLKGTNNYESQLTSVLLEENISIYIDGIETDEIIKTLSEPTISENEVTYMLTLSNFETTRKNGDLYKEWSGNISVKIDEKVLTDSYGNKNMESVDDETGNWSDIKIEDGTTNKNTNNVLFADFIKPEVTYKYSNTNIDQEDKILTVEFDVSDKYYKTSSLQLSDLSMFIDGEIFEINVEGNSLTSKPIDAKGNVLSNEDILNNVSQCGLKYTLVVKNLQQSKDSSEYEKYSNYSGYVSILIPNGKILDYSGNANLSKTITIGLDEPEETGSDAVIVDVVDPTWSYVTSSIDRTNETVSVTIKGTDKYFDSERENNGQLTKNNIKIYLDGNEDANLTNQLLKKISEPTELIEKRNEIYVQYGVQYTLTLGNFQELSGKVTVVIDEDILFDKSGNSNKSNVITDGIIDVGNINWVEEGELNDPPKYTAFRNSIVDFVNPVITYKYFYEEDSNNNNAIIDYDEKTLKIVFDVTDKQFLESNLQITDITVQIDGKDTTGKIKKEFESVIDLYNGKRYILKLSNIQSESKDIEDSFRDFSGIVQLTFKDGVVLDTSGNKNIAKTITIDNDDGDDENNSIIVDVVDPMWEETSSDINYEENDVTVTLTGTDKYYLSNSLTSEKIKVYITDLSNAIETDLLKEGDINSIQKELNFVEEGETYVKYNLKLSDFGEKNGYVYILIEEDTLTDLYQNTNEKTIIKIGKMSEGVFNEGLVDFIKPEWHYETSSIDRENQTVTIDFYGLDKYINKNRVESQPQNLVNNIDIYVGNQKITTIDKELNLINIGTTTMHYQLVLSNFGEYSGITKIVLAKGTLYDTSGNTNESDELNTIFVGNTEGTGDQLREPTYTSFRDSIVDFIGPQIKYDYQNNPTIIDYENRTLKIVFDVTDEFYYRSQLTANDIQISIDNKENTTARVSSLTSKNIDDGIRYTVVLSDFELDNEYGNKQYIDYSGMVQIKIPQNVFFDSSGNGNQEKIITIDYDDGDDTENYIIVDLVKPTFYYLNKIVDYKEEKVTLIMRGTDKYYDFDYILDIDDIRIETEEDLKASHNITMSYNKIAYGYEYTITIENYTEEEIMYIIIPEQKVYDKYTNYNDQTKLTVLVDNQKPVWKYESIDVSNLDSSGTLKFDFRAEDRFLNIENSILQLSDISIYMDGENITDTVNMTLLDSTTEIEEKLKKVLYTLNISGLEDIGVYTIVIAEKVLIDSGGNESNTTTFSFSKSALTSKYYAEVVYYTDTFDYTYVNELYNIDESGTNLNSEVYNPSSLAELWNDGKNETFAETFVYNEQSGTQIAQSFKGWVEADDKGYAIDGGSIYSLYDEIPSTVTRLRAVWQNATVVFVSSEGSDSNSGLSPDYPVQNLETAFSKLASSGTTENNIIVIMNEIEWTSSNTSELLNKNATITSLYAGIDYRKKGAKLKVLSNIYMNSNLVFDNIEIDSTSSDISRTDYLCNLSMNNMLICNYYDLIIGRGVTTRTEYTFGAIVGGNYQTETRTGTIGTHNMIIERGIYNSIVVGSSLKTSSNTAKYVTNNIRLGSKKDGARAQNDKFIITGYLQLSQNENGYYAYNSKGTQNISISYNLQYANIELYSGTFTGTNSWNKLGEDASIYLRMLSNNIEGKVDFKMYGGDLLKSVYAGSMQNNYSPTDIMTEMKFYGGTIESTANVYGQGTENNYIGSSKLIFSGNVSVDGNIYGGANATSNSSAYGTANTNILISGSSVNINGNIYGGSKSAESNVINIENGFINGSTNIEIKSGNISGSIYGGGYSSGIGTYNSVLNTEMANAGTTNINISGGIIEKDLYGGSYQNYVGVSTNINISGSANILCNIYGGGEQLNSEAVGIGVYDDQWYANTKTATTLNPNLESIFGTTNITLLGGIIGESASNSVYGANKQTNINVNDDLIQETTNITIGAVGSTPTINSLIYGSGVWDSVESTNIYVISSSPSNKITVYGGSNVTSKTKNTNIYLNGATVNEIYGGDKANDGSETTNIIVTSGIASKVFGGGNNSSQQTSNIYIDGGTVDAIYGGSNINGIVTTSNITISQGTLTNVYGGGYKTDVVTSNITVASGTVPNVYGGSNLNGTVNLSHIIISGGNVSKTYGGGCETSVINSNITLISGIATTIYGGSYNAECETTNIVLQGGEASNVYGGSYNYDTNTTNINLQGANVKNIYGGCDTSGTAVYTNINLNEGQVQNVYGGNCNGGATINVNITVDGNVDIENSLYGGGYKSNIGLGTTNNEDYLVTDAGNINLNIVNGNFINDINGGSKEALVFGNININIGKDTLETDSSASSIIILGDIFGAGSSVKSENRENGKNYDYEYVSVYGNIQINIDGSNYREFSIKGNIFGAGNAATYCEDYEANIYINDVGTENNIKNITSIQRATNLYIGNSHLEIYGVLDTNNYYAKVAYSLNRIDSLTIYNNTSLYMRRGFNLVKEYNSLVDLQNLTKETVTIKNGTATMNVNNRLYVFDGINLIFATKEGEIYDNYISDSWGDVNGMTFFGLYTYINGTITKDIYDENFEQNETWRKKFYSSSYVEGKQKANHDITVDGFYTNLCDSTNPNNVQITQEYIEAIPYNAYYDWIIGNDTKTYSTTLMASIYSRETLANISLDYMFEEGDTYTISTVDLNRLNSNVNLINPDNVKEVASSESIANTTFGLTIQTNSGWNSSKTTNIYTEDSGKIDGDIYYSTDDSGIIPSIDIKFVNSTNITQNQDLGTVRVIIVGKTRNGEDATEGNTFLIVLNIDLSTLFEEDEYKYMPKFTDRGETKLIYTNDSTVGITYKLYKKSTESIYDSGDYRVLSSTIELPVGTRLTLIDYAQNDNSDDKIYYYIVNSAYNEQPEVYEDGTTRYIYKFSDFTLMGSTDENAKYENNVFRYYSDENQFAFEKYDILIDFKNANITSNKIDQQIYMELRGSNNEIKYDQMDDKIEFDLLVNKNAILTEEVSNEGYTYTLIDNLTIDDILYNVEFREQITDDETTIIDSKYHSQKLGMAIELVDSSDKRVNYPDIIGFSMISKDTSLTNNVYYPDSEGVIRVQLSDGYVYLKNTISLTMTQNNLSSGIYTLKIYLFTSEDGQYYGSIDPIEKDIYIKVISENIGFKVDNIDTANRVIYTKTGKDLLGNDGLNYIAQVTDGLDENSSLRVVLYKRNENYSLVSSVYQYNDIGYTQVDFASYFSNNLVQTNGYEYIIQENLNENKDIEFIGDLKQNIATGEYKIAFKIYSDSNCIQTEEKTFVVIN